jgi:hypothetical protein
MRVLATGFGLMMAAAVALQADGPALVVALVAAVAVVASVRFAPLAVLAVLAAVVAVALSDSGAVLTALAGLSATCYLAVRHGGRGEAVTLPTMLAVFGASAVGVLATTVPVALPWAPLAAPLAVLGAFVIAVRGLTDGT